jgi:hypothetical protein
LGYFGRERVVPLVLLPWLLLVPGRLCVAADGRVWVDELLDLGSSSPPSFSTSVDVVTVVDVVDVVVTFPSSGTAASPVAAVAGHIHASSEALQVMARPTFPCSVDAA